MKKIITLLLLIGGFACAASATKRVWVNLSESNSNWTTANASTAIHYGSMDWNVHTLMSVTYMYGKKWCYYDVDDNVTPIVLKRCSTDGRAYWNWQSVDISWNSSDDLYIKLTEGKKINYTSLNAPEWNYMTCRNNIKNTWDWENNNMTKVDGNTFTYELTKSEIEAYGSYASEGIRFRLRNDDYVNYNDAGYAVNGYPQIYPSSPDLDDGKGEQLSLGGNKTNYNHNTDGTDNYWQINLPDCNYDKVVITAQYVNEGGYKWKISANANVLVTTNDYGYCTLSANVPLTISGATAYYATDKGNGSAEAHKMTKNNPVANTPMLIKGTASTTYSFAVAASGEDNPGSSNAFKAGTGSALASTTDGKYNYILNGNAFYAANDKTVAVGKAYLQLSAAASARALVFADDEATSIEAVDNMPFANDHSVYNLNGQRVNAPQKGLYIVNGRKVVLK